MIATGHETTSAPIAKRETKDVHPKTSIGKGSSAPRGGQKAQTFRPVPTGARERVIKNARGQVEPPIKIVGKWRTQSEQDKREELAAEHMCTTKPLYIHDSADGGYIPMEWYASGGGQYLVCPEADCAEGIRSCDTEW